MPLKAVDSWAELYMQEEELLRRAPARGVKMPDAPAADRKGTNPKDAIGIRKASMSCIPAPFLMALGTAMAEGAMKYGRHNYRIAGVRVSVYYDALMRHMTAYWEGEDIDPESGEHHMIKAAACIAVMYDSFRYGNLKDDRPPKHIDGWQKQHNEAVAALLAKYPKPVQPYTQLDASWAKQAHAEDDLP